VPRSPNTKLVLKEIRRLERHLNNLKIIPATRLYRSAVILPLLSKVLTVSRAICVLIDAGFETAPLTERWQDYRRAYAYCRCRIDAGFHIKQSRIRSFCNHCLVSNRKRDAILSVEDAVHFSGEAVQQAYKGPHRWSSARLHPSIPLV
jgi:hypothetical protein